MEEAITEARESAARSLADNIPMPSALTSSSTTRGEASNASPGSPVLALPQRTSSRRRVSKRKESMHATKTPGKRAKKQGSSEGENNASNSGASTSIASAGGAGVASV